MKKLICFIAVMMLNLNVMTTHMAFASNEAPLLEATFDALADGAKDSLSSSEFTHTNYDYSNGAETNSNTEVTVLEKVSIGSATTMEIGSAGSGKSGKALIYKVNGATADQKTQHEFKWVPAVKSSDNYGRENMQVTYEFSIRAPENTGGGYQLFDYQIPIDGSPRTVVSLQAKPNVNVIYAYDKTNGTWQTICNWEAGKWYNVAVVFTPGTNKIDYYLDGKLVCKGIHDKNYSYIGGCCKLIHSATINENSIYTDTLAIDDVKVYIGTPDIAKYSTTITSSSYTICNNTIIIDSASVDHGTFLNNLSAENGGNAEVYTDSTYSTVAQSVTEGCKLVATSANGRVIGYYDIVEKYTILNCDLESSYGIAENAAPLYEGNLVGDNNTGKGSIGFAGDFTKYTKGNVINAGAGKDGYAYFFDVNNTTGATGNPAIDFKFIPYVTSGKVTFEISMLAPKSYDTITPSLYVPFNGSYKVLFSFQPDGKLSVNNAYIRQWVPGRWYNFAVEMTIGSGRADFYLNGDKVLDDSEVYVNLNSEGVIEVVQGRMRFEATAPTGVSDVTAFDDVKVYAGEYDKASNSVLLESKSSDYSISEYGYIFIPTESKNVTTLNSNISGTFDVYENDRFESKVNTTEKDNILVARSQNGNVVKYYTLIPDGTIAVIINDSATTKLPNRETITVGAMARSDNANVFAASYDYEGVFVGLSMIDATGATNRPAKVSFNPNAGDVVRLMLWDKDTNDAICNMVTIKK